MGPYPGSMATESTMTQYRTFPENDDLPPLRFFKDPMKGTMNPEDTEIEAPPGEQSGEIATHSISSFSPKLQRKQRIARAHEQQRQRRRMQQQRDSTSPVSAAKNRLYVDTSSEPSTEKRQLSSSPTNNQRNGYPRGSNRSRHNRIALADDRKNAYAEPYEHKDTDALTDITRGTSSTSTPESEHRYDKKSISPRSARAAVRRSRRTTATTTTANNLTTTTTINTATTNTSTSTPPSSIVFRNSELYQPLQNVSEEDSDTYRRRTSRDKVIRRIRALGRQKRCNSNDNRLDEHHPHPPVPFDEGGNKPLSQQILPPNSLSYSASSGHISQSSSLQATSSMIQPPSNKNDDAHHQHHHSNNNHSTTYPQPHDDDDTTEYDANTYHSLDDSTTKSATKFEWRQSQNNVNNNTTTTNPPRRPPRRRRPHRHPSASYDSEADTSYMTEEGSLSKVAKRYDDWGKEQTSPVWIDDDTTSKRMASDQSTPTGDNAPLTPNIRTAAGLAGCVALGAIIMGPVALLVGACSVGMVAGVMQIPEDQRREVKDKASEGIKKVGEQVGVAGEIMGNSCVVACQKSGLQEKLPPEVRCCVSEMGRDPMAYKEKEKECGDVSTCVVNGKGLTRGVDHKVDYKEVVREELERNGMEGGRPIGRKVACFRKSRITPVTQIHALEPVLQPKAWLDVMASSLTTIDDKNEAMEEILILAKDKNHARMFLEEGILDSLMWILGAFFKKHPMLLHQHDAFLPPATPTLPSPSMHFYHPKLAANCCIALGKAHCAVVHTEGDLLLMSAYNRGSVPVERQLAQMLYEVPHHTRVAKMEGEGEEGQVDGGGEFFALTEMTMQQAEELAKSIKALVDGRFDSLALPQGEEGMFL